MTRIKVCGLTRHEDAALAAEAGADALGFILVPGTPRCVAQRDPRELLAGLPPCALRVGVAWSLDDVPEAWRGRLDAVQVFDDAPSAAWLPRRRIRVIRVTERAAVLSALAEVAPADAYVLDAYSDQGLGGLGHVCDWELAAEAVAASGRPMLLAGGLGPDNVAEAVRRVRPYGVDVSSGVEVTKRVKDAAKVRAFIAAVRAADAGL